MDKNYVAKASINIDAPSKKIWEALVDPAAVQKYMFGAQVVSDWKVGSPIVWRGMWEGKPFEDRGVILEVKPGKEIRYSHYSPLSGDPDKPEFYHNISIELSGNGTKTNVTLTQEHNASE